jgi:hypothetical protein
MGTIHDPASGFLPSGQLEFQLTLARVYRITNAGAGESGESSFDVRDHLKLDDGVLNPFSCPPLDHKQAARSSYPTVSLLRNPHPADAYASETPFSIKAGVVFSRKGLRG